MPVNPLRIDFHAFSPDAVVQKSFLRPQIKGMKLLAFSEEKLIVKSVAYNTDFLARNIIGKLQSRLTNNSLLRETLYGIEGLTHQIQECDERLAKRLIICRKKVLNHLIDRFPELF